MKWIETVFEALLWNSRFIVIIAVLASLATAASMFFIASVDAYNLVSHLGDYLAGDLSIAARKAMRAQTITHVVEVVDGYLLSTVLLIFALGLYELFISPIEIAKGSETFAKILIINDLDDLKNRLVKVILMILVVNFFEHATSMKFDEPIKLLTFAGGIALIGLALYLSHASEGAAKKSGPASDHHG
ncbi:MAG: hypothetical protein C0605_09240 [Hyphomicrobiales bacterium]|nr:MAG: hypothetical protein C0605_09240 [Hyphomicrobiales bacterium]